ncbi:MAG: DOMON domain-containing protein [Brevinematia bacterium]
MRVLLFIITFSVFSLCAFGQINVNVDGKIDDNEYSSVYNVDKDFKVYISYDNNNVYVGLSSNSKGWVSVGFGSPVMDKSIMFIGYFDKKSNKFYVEQNIGVKHNHVKAEKNEVIKFSGNRDSKTTTLEFVIPRKLIGLELKGKVPVIWAYSSSDSLKTYHSKRGKFDLNF